MLVCQRWYKNPGGFRTKNHSPCFVLFRHITMTNDGISISRNDQSFIIQVDIFAVVCQSPESACPIYLLHLYIAQISTVLSLPLPVSIHSHLTVSKVKCSGVRRSGTEVASGWRESQAGTGLASRWLLPQTALSLSYGTGLNQSVQISVHYTFKNSPQHHTLFKKENWYSW